MNLLREVYRRDKVLTLTAWLHMVILVVLLVASMFDERTLLGVSVWSKPMKFAASIAIFLFTVAWFMGYITGPRWAKRTISIGASVAMIAEIVCITGQSARGTTSHFNIATPLDNVVFSMMGAMITFNLLLMVGLLVLFFTRQRPLSPAYLWGIRFGLGLFCLASLQGFTMVAHMGHAVGRTDAGPERLLAEIEIVNGAPVAKIEALADGGPGLPLANFSTEGGDLRVAHAAGLHALQILPILGFLIGRRWPEHAARQKAVIFVVSLVYAAVMSFLFWQAVSGYPVVRL